MSFSVCLVCGDEDSYRATEDCHFCQTCYSVEQDFLWLEQYGPDFTIDENGNIYNVGLEFDGPIARIFSP